MIGQILEYNTVVTKAEFLFMIQSVNLPPSAHAITSSAHCRYTIQCTLQQIFSAHCSKSSVHTATILSSAHCSKSSVHTAATLSGSNTVQYIQYTFEPPQGKPIPLLAYLQDSQQTLMVDYSCPYDEEDWLFVAVH